MAHVSGDPENALYQGYTCPKGRALPDQHNHPDRLLSSVKRTPSGSHAPISSTAAMDEIAEGLQALLTRHGPRSIALYVGTNTLPYAASPGLALA